MGAVTSNGHIKELNYTPSDPYKECLFRQKLQQFVLRVSGNMETFSLYIAQILLVFVNVTLSFHTSSIMIRSTSRFPRFPTFHSMYSGEVT